MPSLARWRALPRRQHVSAVVGLALATRLYQWAPPASAFASGLGSLLRLPVGPRAGPVAGRPARRALSSLSSEEALVDSDPRLQGKLQGLFESSLASMVEEGDEGRRAVVAVADPRFGDYQCNSAMQLFKRQKREKGVAPQWKNPREVGMAIKDGLPAASAEILESVNVAPQGFVTVKLKTSWIEDQVRALYKAPPELRTKSPQRIVIDYSSPNIAKEMHVGHLRSTILGDTAANLMELLGHEVVRLNHVGDWGTQFGMLLEFMKKEGGLGDGGQDELMVSDLQSFYRRAKIAFDEDDDFKKAAQSNVVALQSGEPWAREAWQKICEASRGEFHLVYSRLGIKGLAERGESFYNPLLPSVVADLTEQGLVQEDNGAKCIFTNVSEAPLIVQKADGGYGYDSTDCAAVLHRLREEKADRVIYVIDNGQESHMRMVFDVADRAGWLQGRRLDFMGFGLVQGEDGKKFKTRSGDVVRLRDLLDEAANRAEEELKKRTGKEEFDEETQAQLRADAERIGVAAVKYFDLRSNRNSDYRFSYNAMLDPKGNTAVYVLYAYARIAAILRKSGKDGADLDPSALAFTEPSERTLALRLLRLPEVLMQVQDDLLPNRLIDYVYGLAVDFTSFYTDCIVVGSDSEASRLVLIEVVRRTLKQCLAIIGIEPLDRL